MAQQIVDAFQTHNVAVHHTDRPLERFAANEFIERVPVQRAGELIVMAHAPQMRKQLASLPNCHNKMRQDFADLRRFADALRPRIVQAKEAGHPILVQQRNQQDRLRRAGLQIGVQLRGILFELLHIGENDRLIVQKRLIPGIQVRKMLRLQGILGE